MHILLARQLTAARGYNRVIRTGFRNPESVCSEVVARLVKCDLIASRCSTLKQVYGFCRGLVISMLSYDNLRHGRCVFDRASAVHMVCIDFC